MTRRSGLPLILAALGLAASLVAVTAPPDQLEAIYEWSPSDDGLSSPLVLVEGEPDYFWLSAPCQALLQPGQRIFSTSGKPDEFPALVINAVGGGAQINVPTDLKDPTSYQTLTLRGDISQECKLEVTYEKRNREIQTRLISAQGQTQEIKTIKLADGGGFEITGLHWAPDVAPNGVQVKIVTSPFISVRPSTTQLIALSVLTLMSLIALTLWAVNRPERASNAPSKHRLAPYKSEWAMLAFITFVMIVDLPRYDDGWYFLMFRTLSNSGVSSNIFFDFNIAHQFDFALQATQALVQLLLGTSLISSRTFSLVIVMACYVTLRRMIVPKLYSYNLNKSIMIFIWALFAIFVSGWGATLRWEWVAVLATLLVIGIQLRTLRARPIQVGVVVFLSVSGLLAGSVGFAVALASIPFVPKMLRAFSRNFLPTAIGAIWGLSLGLVLLFFNSSIFRSMTGFGNYNRISQSHGKLPWQEYERIDFLLSVTPSANYFFTLLLFVSSLFIALYMLMGQKKCLFTVRQQLTITNTAFLILLIPLSLLLTSSKFSAHYAILIVPTLLGWLLVGVGIVDLKKSKKYLMLLICLLIGTITALSLQFGKPWAAFSYGYLVDWSSPIFSSKEIGWVFPPSIVWSFCFVVFFVIPLLVLGNSKRQKNRATFLLGYSFMSSLILLSLFQFSPQVIDSLGSRGEWSFIKQNLKGFFDADATCGIPADTPAPIAGAFTMQEVFTTAATFVAVPPQTALLASCINPPLIRDGVVQIPEFAMGTLSGSHRKFGGESNSELWGCHRRASLPQGQDLCFERLVVTGKPIWPSEVTWRPWTQ